MSRENLFEYRRVRFRWLEGQADAVVRIFCDDQLQVGVWLPGDLY